MTARITTARRTARRHSLFAYACLTAMTMSANSAQAADTNLATVNEQSFDQTALEAYVATSNRQKSDDKAQIIKEMINLELLKQAAQAQGLDKDPAVVAAIEWQTRQYLAQQAIRRFLSENPVSEDEVRKAYDASIASAPKQTYQISQVVTANENDAREILAELEKGTAMDDLFKSPKAIGNSGRFRAWLQPMQIPVNVAKALESVKKGEYTLSPVQTEAGWHVVRVDDVRDLTPPPFENVEAQLRNAVENNRIAAYVDSLRSKAQVTVAEP